MRGCPAPRSGSAAARAADSTLLTQAQDNAPAEFAFGYTIDANRSLTITLHEVYLALAKTPIEGPAGVEASFAFRAAYNATATRMMTVVLRNQQQASEYA
ncbi:phage tail tube protein [Caldovatus aquaticus]|uniref:phage tail tube protein n=1 Tax=Caldovatus aquaticus TaxID=2865671 RepID=UPI002105E253|nr:phage tail tube protein [Caldovatus aquaticus]